MTVKELMRVLENMDPDAEVRLAMQPSYPLAFGIDSVVDLPDEDAVDEDDPGVVWIAATESAPFGESPYAPREAWQAF